QYLLDVDGPIRTNTLFTASSQSVGGNLTVAGNTILGTATSTNTLELNARLATSLIPTVDNAIDIGSDTLGFRTGYFSTSVGIGTTSPYANLSVEGFSALGNSATAGYFVATTTTATSTF